MKRLNARLIRLERMKGTQSPKIYILRVGNAENCQFSSEAELNEELKNPKYKDAILIRDLDNWI